MRIGLGGWRRQRRGVGRGAEDVMGSGLGGSEVNAGFGFGSAFFEIGSSKWSCTGRVWENGIRTLAGVQGHCMGFGLAQVSEMNMRTIWLECQRFIGSLTRNDDVWNWNVPPFISLSLAARNDSAALDMCTIKIHKLPQ
jgi:hypothetical protein